MSGKIPDFNANELAIIHSNLNKRYGRAIEVQLADSEVQLDSNSAETKLYPTVFWYVAPVSFVILKLDSTRYRGLFVYGEDEHYGTGVDDYHDLSTCVIQLLQAQADHAAHKRLS